MSDPSPSCPQLWELLGTIPGESSPPAAQDLFPLFTELNALYAREAGAARPADASGRPGGLVLLDGELPTVIIPDIHARPRFVYRVLMARPEALGGDSVFEALCAGTVQLVCVGDYFHGEGRVRLRWQRALLEFSEEYRKSPAMDAEMTESLAVLRMLGALKLAFPSLVHLLKGNHENVANESGDGNYPFGKFAYEGAMVATYIELKYSERLLSAIRDFEKFLPVVAVGRRFAISHAEPAIAFERPEIVNYRDNPEVIYGLTWTADDEAEDGSVERTLPALIEPEFLPGALWFGGHRPVAGRFNLRANGKYVQINNPTRYVMGVLPADRPADPERDIVDIGYIEEAQDDTGSR